MWILQFQSRLIQSDTGLCRLKTSSAEVAQIPWIDLSSPGQPGVPEGGAFFLRSGVLVPGPWNHEGQCRKIHNLHILHRLLFLLPPWLLKTDCPVLPLLPAPGALQRQLHRYQQHKLFPVAMTFFHWFNCSIYSLFIS